MGFDLTAVAYEPTEGPLHSHDTFHANVWSWRVMVAAIDTALEGSDYPCIDGAEASGLVFNDGYIVPKQRSVELADAAEAWLGDSPNDSFLTLYSDGGSILRVAPPHPEGARVDLSQAIDDGSAWTTDVGFFRSLLRFFRTSGGFEVW